MQEGSPGQHSRLSHKWTQLEEADKRNVGHGGKCHSCRNKLKAQKPPAPCHVQVQAQQQEVLLEQ